MLIRETDDPEYEQKIVASYDYGRMIDKNVANMSEAEITGKILRIIFEPFFSICVNIENSFQIISLR